MSTLDHVVLPITGMTCASCANRIERNLNELDGVSASVNYATEKATVDFDPAAVDPHALVAAVEAAGYQAALPATGDADAPAEEAEDPTAPLRRRLIISALLALPVLLLSMIPALQFDNWQWLALQLATPVVIWGAWPLHRAAWANLKHATATMDTLISVGTLTAWLWSLYALFIGNAGATGMKMPFDLWPDPNAGSDHLYLETAAAVTVFVLAGRYFEARAKRRAGAALEALLELGAKDVAILGADGAERRVPVEQLARRRPLRRAPGREGRDRRGRRGGHLRGRPVAADRRVGAGGEAAGRRGRRRDRQRGRPARRPRDQGRLRHRAGADRAAGHRRAVGQGRRPAARGPRVGRLRPDRDRDRGRDARLLDRRRRGDRVRGHRRGRRADHRLPVRARPRDADGACSSAPAAARSSGC